METAWSIALAILLGASPGSSAGIPRGGPSAEDAAWIAALLQVPYPELGLDAPVLELLRQDFERLERNRSVLGTPLRIGERAFERGLGTHAASRIRVRSPVPLERFSAWAGIDANDRTRGGAGSAAFAVLADGREVFRSSVLRGGGAPVRVDAALGGARTLELLVDDAGDGPACDHADWAEAMVALPDGRALWLDELARAPGFPRPRFPFSFLYGGRPADELLPRWKLSRRESAPPAAAGIGGEPVATAETIWLDPETGLEVVWEVRRFPEHAAADWVLRFRNAGTSDTKILEEVQALDLAIARPEGGAFVLHRTNGAPANPTDFEPRRVVLERGKREELGGRGGLSSYQDFPFFKLEAGPVSWIVAVGWSGQWKAAVESPDGEHARIRAGLERLRLYLRPGESVRTPRILVFRSSGDTLEANARFRRLIYERYAARRRAPDGSFPPPFPILFSNTCFTRGGGWLNECDAENQISLIRAYGPLGLEAVVTDAGWFEGGWPAGSGSWTPRRDAYPEGMGPVAAAALDRGMVYGLWFEPERAAAGSQIHREHPEWLLSDGSPNPRNFLVNLGLPEAREHLFRIVKGFLDLPGFRFYRQDCTFDPLPFWRANDPPDREGITEIRHVEGLYAFWERIAAERPDSIREECASGGRRIDLETIQRMHLHQESDWWFDDIVDQAQIWGLSQYLPNCVFTTPIARLDDTTFRSTLATSLCVGWIADEPGFDAARAKRLLDRYREVRHLLVGAWYPLLPYSRAKDAWMASQFHRPDLGEGMVLAFRREESPYRTAEVRLRGLDPDATYELAYDSSGEHVRARGADLLRSFLLTLPEPRSSELIAYRAVRDGRPAERAERALPPDARAYFRISVVDAETGRGVPLVELRTTNEIACWTDSAGNVAFYEPGLMGRPVFFHVRSHGYEFPADGFGYRGKALTPVPGGSAVLEVRRRNIAERLYRVTGQGIYRDTWLLGLPVPTREPLLDGEVMGQDSVMSTVYRGKIYWFWGDTLRASYPLGHFGTSGATSELPGRGGLDPSVGVDLRYFVDASGFSRPVCEVPGTGLKWIGGLMTVPDETGRERLIAKYSIHKSLAEILESGLAIFDDEKEALVPLRRFDGSVRLYPDGRPFRASFGGADYYYCSWPYPIPCVRVRADFRAIADPAAYEAWTPLPAGSAYEKGRTRLERGPDGKPAYRWRPATHALDHDRVRELVAAGELREDEAPFRFLDVETGKPIRIGGDANWNPYRRRWILLGLESGGSTSFLGEVWYAEGDTPLGPWVYARKVVTHDRYSFYWPGHHPFFDQDGGRTIYFEGTYTEAFSGNPEKTPAYNYNQILYRLRLDDPRLVLPVPVYRLRGPAGPRYALRGAVEALGAWGEVEEIPFFAVEPGRPLEGAIEVVARREGRGMRLRAGGAAGREGGGKAPGAAAPGAGEEILFLALPAERTEGGPASEALVPLYEHVPADGGAPVYSARESVPGCARSEKPLARVWRNPLSILPIERGAKPGEGM